MKDKGESAFCQRLMNLLYWSSPVALEVPPTHQPVSGCSLHPPTSRPASGWPRDRRHTVIIAGEVVLINAHQRHQRM